MEKYYNCSICNSNDYIVLYSAREERETPLAASEFSCTSAVRGTFGQIIKCRNCNLVYRNPRGSDEETERYYRNVVDRIYLEEIRGREKTFQKSLRDLKRFKSGGRLLDIGCYVGTFLYLARKDGWETYGCELSTWAASYAREKHGLEVQNCTVSGLDFPARHFDAITLWDTIEHLNDPLKELKHIRKLLKPDGILCLSTMNINSFFARVMGRRWPWLMKMHYYYFTPSTLTKILTLANFKVLAWHNYLHYASMRYLGYKLSGYSLTLSRLLLNVLKKLKLQDVCLPVNLKDFNVFYARRQ